MVKLDRPVANQRTVYVRLLAEGRKRVLNLIPRVIDYEDDLSACFSESELRIFKTLLEKFFHSLVEEGRSIDNPEQMAG